MLASYYSTPAWVWYLLGFASCVLLLYVLATLDRWLDKYEEFKEWKNDQKPKKPEVVDAQFINIRPRPSPQLNNSTSLVRRTSVERRKA